MKIAVASQGTVPEALVGVRFGVCTQFLVFDTETQEYLLMRVPPRQEPSDQVSLTAIRALAGQGVSVVITGEIKERCRQTLEALGIEVIDGVTGMTVQEAVARYQASGMRVPESRRGWVTKIAVVATGEGLEAFLDMPLEICTSFVIVDPATLEWRVVEIPARGPAREVSLAGVRAIVESGAGVLITPRIHPECCMALQALAVSVYLAPEGITVREALQLYQAGQLEEALYAF